MDIHKPKPWHGLREFLKEYLIIVVGVLTALGAEQVVEAVRTAHEIHEARAALDHELAYNLGARDFRVSEVACVQRRLDELQRWAAGWGGGPPPKLLGPIGRPANITPRFAVWTASGKAVSDMPQSVRIAYSELYDAARLLQGYRESEAPGWADLSKYRWARRLDDRDRMEVLNQIETLRRVNEQVAQTAPLAAEAQKVLGIAPAMPKLTAATESFRTEICRPVLAGAPPAAAAPTPAAGSLRR